MPNPETVTQIAQVNIWEIGMLVCFGAGWPVSVLKTLRTRISAGKSIFFLCIVMVGYACGIMFKLTGQCDLVILLYIFNLTVVSLDTYLTIKYRNNPITPAG